MRGKVSNRTLGELVIMVLCMLVVLAALLVIPVMIGFAVDLVQGLVDLE